MAYLDHAATTPMLPVAVEAGTRCLAGRAYVAVRATNDADVALDVTLATPYGSRTVAGVAPGRRAQAHRRNVSRAAR